MLTFTITYESGKQIQLLGKDKTAIILTAQELNPKDKITGITIDGEW